MIYFYFIYILQDKYVLSGLVFLGFMAIEDAVAAVIPDPDAQRLFDRICLYVGVGLIKRTCKDLKDTTTLKTLFCSLVRSNLEYCSVVWSPFTKRNRDKLERIQRRDEICDDKCT